MTGLEAPDIETSSDGYAERFRGPAGSWLLKVQGEAIVKMLSKRPPARVLEVGGGHGQLVPFLIKAGHRVLVLGSDESCRNRVEQFVRSGSCEFKTGNLFELPFPDHSFEVVVALHLFPHIVEWKRFAEELMRIAERTVVIDVPTKSSLNGLLSSFFWLKKHVEGNTRTFITYRERDVITFFEQHGFKVENRFAKFFMPMVVHRLLHWPALSWGIETIFRSVGLTQLFGSPSILCLVREELGRNTK